MPDTFAALVPLSFVIILFVKMFTNILVIQLLITYTKYSRLSFAEEDRLFKIE